MSVRSVYAISDKCYIVDDFSLFTGDYHVYFDEAATTRIFNHCTSRHN